MKKRAKQRTFYSPTKSAAVSLAPPPWDMGATGQANQSGLEIEDAAEIDPETGEIINPNAIKRARRVDPLKNIHRRGLISTEGYSAAEKLRDAYEATQRTPGWPDNDQVDSSPKPDHAVTIQIDRLSKYYAIARHVHPLDRDIIAACVLDRHGPDAVRDRLGRRTYYGPNVTAGYLHLRAALDRLARRMENNWELYT